MTNPSKPGETSVACDLTPEERELMWKALIASSAFAYNICAGNGGACPDLDCAAYGCRRCRPRTYTSNNTGGA